MVPVNGKEKVKLTNEENSPFAVNCNIHKWMGGKVLVRKNPYATVSAKDGKFEIKDLPAGAELEFRVAHGAAGALESIPFGKSAKVGKKGAVKLTVAPGENDLGEIKVPLSALKSKK